MVPLSYAYDKIAPLSYTSRISQNNIIFRNHHVFPGFSVVLIQLCSHFCQNVAPFDILRFSHHFFYFAADFASLSYTDRNGNFPYPLIHRKLKKGIPFGQSLPVYPIIGSDPLAGV